MYKILRVLQGLLVFFLFLGLLGQAPVPSRVDPVKAQPQLVHMAAEKPDQVVKVIVQEAAKSDHVEKLVVQLGGKIEQDLHIIKAFSADLTASAALELSRDSAVRWVSLDSPVAHSGEAVNTSNLQSVYLQAIGADRVWNEAPAYLHGEGVAVAVVDSGDCSTCIDLKTSDGNSRYLAEVSVKANNNSPTDYYGHGTLVLGMLGANGNGSNGHWLGVAPAVSLVSVKVSNILGFATVADVVNGLQWVLDNKDVYNIRVVNLSLNSTQVESYHTSPIDAAVEILWFNKIVVVVSAGNHGSSALYPPANDPFVITVGATDDKGTVNLSDDDVASFSAYGTTESGFSKPDLVAPGRNLISFTPKARNLIWKLYSSHLTGETNDTENFMRVSGTSMAAPLVSGAVALLLQNEPNLTPDQVKYRLLATANKGWPGYDPSKAGAGYLDIYAAIHGATTESANTNISASQLLWTGDQAATWDSVAWNSVAWNSVAWNSVAWNSVAWNSVAWNSDYWEP